TNHINDMTNGFNYVYGQLTTQAAIDLYNKYKGKPNNYGAPVDMTSKGSVAMQIINSPKSSSGWDFQYTNITIKAGTTVTWTNISSAPHTVTSGQGSPDGKFDSRGNNNALLLPGNAGASSVFSFTFKTPGTYYYYCTLHPTMIGEITVVAG
ncbi:MAG TPA: plastocyanin/azurin family copper-binding protein, partial [Ktedonobacterales bacterium]